jgi:hypothetical protein
VLAPATIEVIQIHVTLEHFCTPAGVDSSALTKRSERGCISVRAPLQYFTAYCIEFIIPSKVGFISQSPIAISIANSHWSEKLFV